MQENDFELLSDFPVVIRLPVLWGDQDVYCHVNNTTYIRWFESARVAYMIRVGFSHQGLQGYRPGSLEPILAAVHCDFRRPLTFPDSVQIGTRISRIGRTSMTLQHKLVSEAHHDVAAEGTSVFVVFDYSQHKSQPVPESLREAIEKLEGKTF